MHAFAAHFLTVLIVLPALGAGLILIARERAVARSTAIFTTLLTFAASLALPVLYDWRPHAVGHAGVYAVRSPVQPDGVIQQVENRPLVPAFSIRYFVGVDGLSLPLVLLTTFISLLACIASWSIETRIKPYFAMILLLEACLLGLFLSLNFALFFAFHALSILPLYFLIRIGGGLKRRQASIKFLLYMLVGTGGLFIAVLGVFHYAGSLDLVALPALMDRALATRPHSWSLEVGLFALTMICALFRVPGFPFHTWLSDAHAEASTPVSMMLSALFLPTGSYVMVRVAYPLFHDGAQELGAIVAIIGVLGMLNGAFSALVQRDLKRVAACVSVWQMGLVLLGFAILTPSGIHGALFLWVVHGLGTAMLFFLIGALSDRVGHRDRSRMSGLAGVMPRGWAFFLIAAFASAGLPLFCGFVGQLLVLTGTFQAAFHNLHLAYAASFNSGRIFTLGLLACAGLVLMACSLMGAIHRVFMGPPRAELSTLSDLAPREIGILVPLVTAALALGIMPAPLYFNFTRATVQALRELQQRSQSAPTQTLGNNLEGGESP